jgi:branched-chain amino acid transport system substrate-binding protein
MARTLVEGLKRAGKDLTRDKLIAALEGLSNTDLGGYRSPTAQPAARARTSSN